MNMIIFSVTFISLSILYLWLGYAASKTIETTTDYFLAGRSLGFWSLALTLIATQLGGGLVLGTAAEAYNTGYYGIFYSVGMALGFLILGLGLAAKLREFNVSTMPELFETRYGSPFLRKIATVLSALSLCGISAALVVSSSGLIKGLGISNEWINVAFWAITIAYTMMGGLKAVVVTDIVQVCVIVAVFVSVFIYSLLGEPASFWTLSNFVALPDSFGSGAVNFTGFFLMPVLFSLVEQDLAQRFFAAKNRSIAVAGALAAAAGIFAFTAIPVYFGMKARLLGLVVPAGANPLIIALQSITNDVMTSFVVCGVLAAIVSTADSLLCATGSLLAQDFGLEFSSQKRQLMFSQVTILVTGLFAVIVGYFFDNILALMTQSYELPVSCLFIPLIWCFFSKGDLPKRAAALAIVAGGVGFILFRAWEPAVVPREVATLALSLAGFVAGMWIEQPVLRQD